MRFSHQKWFKFPILALSLIALSTFVFVSCSSGIAKSEYDALNAELDKANLRVTELEATSQSSAQLIKELSAISAYLLWYDNYYGKEIYTDGNDAFDSRIGSLIAACGNDNSSAAFMVYLQANEVYREIVATLPKDDSVWTVTQYNNWIQAGKARADALGQVGGHLYAAIKNISWFKSP
ncbi:MAG: hypothetical protein ABIB93_04020 [Chloroflexota bacterium]